jgi:hypothetical protein
MYFRDWENRVTVVAAHPTALWFPGKYHEY